MKYQQINDPAWLSQQVQEKPLRQIAEEIGCSYSAVMYQVRKNSIAVPRRTKRRANALKSQHIIETLRKKYPDGRFGEQASNWKGGRHRLKTGYVTVYQPNHPRAGRVRRVFEHILVAEQTLGRYLAQDEVVHHINGIKDDNRPENLEVVKRKDHTHKHFTSGMGIQALHQRIKYLEELLEANEIEYREVTKV